MSAIASIASRSLPLPGSGWMDPTDMTRASELLSSLPKQYRTAPHLPFSPPQQQTFPPPSASNGRDSLAPYPLSPSRGPINIEEMPVAGPSRERARTMHGVEMEEEEDVLEEDEWQLAKTYFDMKEFDRVVWTLREARGARDRFLKAYAGFLVGQRYLSDER